MLLGVGVVYTVSYQFKPESSTQTGTPNLYVLAYYGVDKLDGGFEAFCVQVLVTVIGPENYTGTTTTNQLRPLNFTVVPGQYTVSGTYNSTLKTKTVNVTAEYICYVYLNFGDTCCLPGIPPAP
jgi:hypothetical protein